MTAQTSSNSPLRIDTIAVSGCCGLIGMTLCPGKNDRGYFGTLWERDLVADLDTISSWGAEAVVTLMESFEMIMLKIDDLPSLLRQREIEWHHLPIRDADIPDERFTGKWRTSGPRLKEILSAGGNILLHCRGGLGRTGTVAAMLLVDFGVSPAAAISMVRAARPGTIETLEQEQYVLKLNDCR